MLRAAVMAGLVTGTGLLLVLREVLPSQPDLGAALSRLSGTTPTGTIGAGPVTGGVQGRVGRALERRLGGSRVGQVPQAELALLRTTSQAWFAQKALYALVGLAFPALFAIVVTLIGLRPPVAIPAGASILLATGMWFLPDLDVRVKASTARAEFARAVTAYIDLTALERAGGSGASQALERAAAVGDSWVFERLREDLQRARWAGTPPWQALSALAGQIGVPELDDVADIMRLSGEQGASVYENLRARSRGMRTAQLTREQSRANADSERMVIPVAFLGLIFLALLAYPAMVRVL